MLSQNSLLKSGPLWYVLNNTHNCSGKTMNYFFRRFTKHNVFQSCWKTILELGIINKTVTFNKLSIDASLIKNINGIDCIGKNNCDRGRNGTKHSIIVNEKGIPISSIFSPANMHDVTLLTETFNNIICNKPKGCRKKPQYVLADKGYDSEKHRVHLRNLGYIPLIPLRKNSKRILTKYQKTHYVHDSNRNNVEIVFGRLDNYRRITVRREKRIKYYETFAIFGLCLISYNKIF